MTWFPVWKSDTLVLILALALSTSCLLLMAIGVTPAHSGDYLITSILLVAINNPRHAIIHAAIFINTFTSAAVQLHSREVSSLLNLFYNFEVHKQLSVGWINGPVSPSFWAFRMLGHNIKKTGLDLVTKSWTTLNLLA